MSNKVAVYIRYNKSVEKMQLEETLNFAKANGLDLYKIYIDVCSGLASNPPELTKLIKEAKNFDKVLVYSLDRISRNVTKFREIQENLIKSNVNIYSVKECLTV